MCARIQVIVYEGERQGECEVKVKQNREQDREKRSPLFVSRTLRSIERLVQTMACKLWVKKIFGGRFADLRLSYVCMPRRFSVTGTRSVQHRVFSSFLFLKSMKVVSEANVLRNVELNESKGKRVRKSVYQCSKRTTCTTITTIALRDSSLDTDTALLVLYFASTLMTTTSIVICFLCSHTMVYVRWEDWLPREKGPIVMLCVFQPSHRAKRKFVHCRMEMNIKGDHESRDRVSGDMASEHH